MKLSTNIPASPKEVYQVFLDSKKHTKLTGDRAVINPQPGGKFTAGDDYISGTIITMEENKKIVQKWRTTDFPLDAPDSTLEILLEPIESGTKLTLIHTEIPDGQKDDYEDGWKEFYFTPLKAYFKKKSTKKKTKI